MKRIFSSALAFAAAAVMTSAFATDWGLVGDFQGWNAGDAVVLEETAPESNVFVAEVEHLSTGFKVVADFSFDFNYGMDSDTSAVLPGEPVELVENGANFAYGNRIMAINNAKVTLDLNANTLTVEGTDIEYLPESDTYSLVGSFNGWDVADETTEFKADENGALYLAIPAGFLSSEDVTAEQFKVVCNHSWQPENWGGEEGEAFIVDLPYTLVKGGNPGNISIAEGTVVTDKMYFLLDTTGEDFTLTLTEEYNPSGVAVVAAEAVVGNVYNVAGVCVAKNVKNVNGLAKGLYIFNGKKVIVK